MNVKQRKILQILQDKLESFIDPMENLKELLEGMGNDEQDKFNNLSEGLQAAERGQQIEQAADSLNDVVTTLESVIDDLRGSLEVLGTIE